MSNPRFSQTDTPAMRARKLNELRARVETGGSVAYALVDIGGGAVGAREVTVGPTPPASPVTGQSWIDTN